MPVLLLWKVIRPVLPYLLAFVALIAGATAVGMVTGWWDMHALLLDALFQTLHTAFDAVVAAGADVVDWLLNQLAARLSPF